MDWHFVLLEKNTTNAGWWLKIDNIEQLSDYLEQTNDQYAKALKNYITDKEFQPTSVSHNPYLKEIPLTYALAFHQKKTKQNIIKTIVNFANIQYINMANAILDHGCIYMNKNGGYFWDKNQIVDEFIYRSELVFPEFDKSDIHIRQFPNDTHFYAYLGDMQVRDGNKLKYDSYEEAYAQANACLTNNKK